jgi:hypothetical protein
MHSRMVSFEEIHARGDALRRYLAQCRIALHPASTLARALESAGTLVQFWRTGSVPVDADTGRMLEDLDAVDALAAVVLSAEGTVREPALIPRLRSLVGGDPRFTAAGERSQQRDDVFEIVCWHVVAQFASNPSFEEPDVRCEFHGRTWGLACKAIYEPDGAVRAIRTGWRQLLTSPVEVGFVAAHLTNLFPHERMYAHAADGDVLSVTTMEELSSLFGVNLKSAARDIEAGVARSPRREDRTRLQGILYAAHSFPYFKRSRYRIGGVLYQPMAVSANDDASAFVAAFNDCWQDLSNASQIAG